MKRELPQLSRRTLESATFDRDCHEWIFLFDGPYALRVASPWRATVDDEIELGWEDDGQTFGLPGPLDASERLGRLVVGKQVESAELGRCGDLSVRIGGAVLEIFHASAGYEGWTLHAPDAGTIAASGGGAVREWKPGRRDPGAEL